MELLRSSFAKPPVSQSFSPLPPPPSCSSPSICYRNKAVRRRKKKAVAMASLDGEGTGLGAFGSMGRRAILLVGASALPLLQLKAVALEVKQEGGKPDSRVLTDQESNQYEQEAVLQNSAATSEMPVSGPEQAEILYKESKNYERVEGETTPGISFLSALNAIRIIGTGVLIALCAKILKEKSALESTMQSLKELLSEKEQTTYLLKKDFETRLLNIQKQQREEIRKLQEDETSCTNQLAYATRAVAELRQELQGETCVTEVLRAQLGQLENSISRAEEDKILLEVELKEKKNRVNFLEDQVNLLALEVNEKEVTTENLRSSLLQNESECAKLRDIIVRREADLSESFSTIEHLKEEVAEVREEQHSKSSSIDELNAKLKHLDTIRSGLHEKLSFAQIEANNVKKMEDELQDSHNQLGASRLEASKLSKELQDSRRAYEELVAKAARMQHEFSEAKASLSNNLKEARSVIEVQTNELMSIKEVLRNMKGELDAMCEELRFMVENHESLKKEHDEATKSLDEMNKSTLQLSRELESANSRNADLETEKEMLVRCLEDQKTMMNETRERIADAEGLITRLGGKRESMERHGKRLEEELAAAKGEILRLRQQYAASKEKPTSENHNEGHKKFPSGTPFLPKSVGKRRKGGSSSGDSQ